MMKKFFTLAMALMALMIANPAMAQTRKEKKAVKKAEWEHQQKMRELQRQRELDSVARLSSEVFTEIPCYAESRSDANYYREVGTGTDLTKDVARKKAIMNAQSMMKERLARTIKGVLTDYSKLVTKSGKNSELSGINEGEYTSVVDAALNDADNPCEKWSQDRSGNWNAYYVIEIAKEKLADDLAKAISEDETLRIQFDREQFRKYAEEYMKKMEESKK